MRLRISIITPEKSLADHFGLSKASSVPKEAASRGFLGQVGTDIVVSTYLCSNHTKMDELFEHIEEISNDAQGIVILYDHRFGHLISDFRKAVFAASFLDSARVDNFNNYFGKFIAKALRNYAFYASRFADAKYQKPLLLPLKNFRADTIPELLQILGQDAPNDFSDRLDRAIASLRNRQTPKKADSYKTVYYRDDADLYFDYGHERHARPATASPHTFGCMLTSKFRFGGRYDEQRHFNVSHESKNKVVSGLFKLCHNGEHGEEGDPHLNMFPNDQIV